MDNKRLHELEAELALLKVQADRESDYIEFYDFQRVGMTEHEALIATIDYAINGDRVCLCDTCNKNPCKRRGSCPVICHEYTKNEPAEVDITYIGAIRKTMEQGNGCDILEWNAILELADRLSKLEERK